MAYDIGTARGVVEMEYNGRGIDQAEADLNKLEQGGKRAAFGMEDAAGATGKAGLAIAAGLGAAVYAAANFEQRMSAVKAVSGATDAEMKSLSSKALQLGKDTQFSASEAAQAIEELVKAGVSVPDVLNGAADAVVALAAAGEIDMPEAATIASNAMNQFNLKAKDMVGVVDNIAGAANASAIDVSDFGQSLQQVGAVANLAGVKFDDVSTAIALMGNAGIKGSDAGTALKTMFSRLQPTTKKAEMAMRDLGLFTSKSGSAFYDAEGNMKSMSQISGLLGNAMKGLSKEQQQQALMTIFGSDAIRAAAIMANNGKKGFDEMAASMGKTTAAEVAADRMDNFMGRLEQLKGSLETAGIAIGQVLLPALDSVVKVVTKWVNAFLSLDSGTQKIIVAIIAAVAALLLITSGVLKFIIFIGRVQASLTLLRGTMIATWAAALGPIALVVAAVALVIAIIVILWKKSETFRDIVIGVWEAIKAAAMAVAQWFMSTIVPFFASVWNAISSAVKVVFGVIATIIRTYITIWITIIRTALNIIKAVWTAVWKTFGPIIKGVFGVIMAIIRLAWTIIKGVFLLNLKLIMATVKAVFGIIKSVISTVMAAIKAVFSAVWGYIGPYVTRVVNTIKGVITGVWNAIKTATSTTWNALKGIIGDAIDNAMSVITNIKERVTGFFSGAASWLVNAGQEIIQGLINGITNMLGELENKINGVAEKIGKFLPGSPVEEGPLVKLNRGGAGKEIVKMVIDGIESMAHPLRSAMDSTVAPAAELAYATPAPGSTPRPRRRTKGGRSRRARLVDGELRLDRSGKAFIRGVAEDVDDDDDDYNDTLGRMN